MAEAVEGGDGGDEKADAIGKAHAAGGGERFGDGGDTKATQKHEEAGADGAAQSELG